MALSEIEKLERRYAENPQGLTFAPLAEVHRKNGDVQRALDLLGSGLALHPDYIPASIVLGRCHLDLGDVPAAEKAFLHVLSLDGENVIALKALADISERLVKFDDAERWLHTLLSVDRSNDEAREQLQRIEVARRHTAGAAVEPEREQERAEKTAAVDQPVAEAVMESPAAAPVYEAPVAEPPIGWVSQSAQVAEFHSPPIEELEPAALGEPFETPGIQLDEPAPTDEEVQPIDGLVGREVDVPDEDEFRVETSEDIVLRSSGGNEFQVPDASLELVAARGSADPPPFEAEPAPPAPQPEPEAPPPEPSFDTATPEPSPEPAFAGFAEPVEERFEQPEQEPPAAEVVTPEPVASAPASAPEPLPPAPKRTYAAGETGGRPVGQLLKDILSARPPAQAQPAPVRQAPAASGSGAPTRPAADALSLSSVFGEEEAPGTPPAVPAAGTGAGVSFDDFFGAPGSAAPTQRNSRNPDPKNDDLDQFHAWLQNLKR